MTKNITDSFFKLTLIGLCIYALSFLGYVYPILNTVVFVLIVTAVIFFSLKDVRYGVFALFFEVLIGVKGYLFSLNVFGFPVSLRLALFLVVFLIWLVVAIREKKEIAFSKSRMFPFFALFTLMVLIGMIVGILNGNSIKNIFFDANGYFYLALIFPLYEVLKTDVYKKQLLVIFFSGGMAITIFSLFVALQFTVFHQESRPDLARSISTQLTLENEPEDLRDKKISHSITAKDELKDNTSLIRSFENKKPAIYRWTQDVSIAEITYLAGPFFRVYSPGQIISLAVFVISFFVVFKGALKEKLNPGFMPDFPTWIYKGMFFLTGFTVLLGFSRSLWFGMLISFVIFLLHIPFKKALKVLTFSILAVLIALFLLRIGSIEAYTLIIDRISSIVNPSAESAGSNRLNVIDPALRIVRKNYFWGQGFGTTVEYESVAPEKFGTLRVFTFEWSYIDTLIETGFIGLILYLLFIQKIYENLAKNKLALFQALLLALLFTNITTPYLNHPLGIGLLILMAGLSRNDE